jgi:hypothetical protein
MIDGKMSQGEITGSELFRSNISSEQADANRSSNKFLIFVTLDRPRRQDFSAVAGLSLR